MTRTPANVDPIVSVKSANPLQTTLIQCTLAARAHAIIFAEETRIIRENASELVRLLSNALGRHDFLQKTPAKETRQ
jgi:hypothetical protein